MTDAAKKRWNKKRIRNRSKAAVWSILRAFVLIGLAFMILYPLLMTLSRSFMGRADMNDSSVVLLPKHVSLESLQLAGEMLNFWPGLVTTLVYVTVITLVQVLVCLMVGYGFGRFDVPFKRLLFALVIFTVVVPPQLYMASLYLRFKAFDIFGLFQLVLGQPLNLINQYTPLLLLALTGAGIKNGLFIYIFRQNFRNMPKEFEEAAVVDGAGHFQIFLRVMVPNAVATIVTVGLFSFVWQYNDSFYGGLFLQDPNLLSMKYMGISEIGSQALKDMAVSDSLVFNPIFVLCLKSAAALLVILPIIVIYLCAQRYFIESVERSGLVG